MYELKTKLMPSQMQRVRNMIEFNKENHEYKFDSKIIPSVTQVLPKQKFWCTPEQLEAARQEGIDNHAMLKMHLDTGETYGDMLINMFVDWRNSHQTPLGDLIQYEKILFSQKYKFAGRPDFIFEKAIVDLKRIRPDMKQTALQLAGYSILAKENKISNAKQWIIIWPDNGVMKAKNVYNPQAKDVFKSLVTKWYIKQNLKNYMEGI